MGRRSQKPQPPWLSSYDLTRATYSNWFQRLYNLAISRFKWNDLPDMCDERFIEQFLFFQPLMVGFKDPIMGEVILPAMQDSNFDIIGDPRSVRAYGYNSNYQREGLTKENSAYLWCNLSRQPDCIVIRQFATRLTKIDRSIDLNLDAQKCPRIAYANEGNRLSVQNLVYQVDKYDPWLYLKGNNTPEDIKNLIGVLDLHVDFIAPQLENEKKETIAEVLTYLGIESNYNMKAERQFTTEVQMTLGQVEGMRFSPLLARKKFCDKFNEKFGTNISVEPRSTLSLTHYMDGTLAPNGDLPDGEPNKNSLTVEQAGVKNE